MLMQKHSFNVFPLAFNNPFAVYKTNSSPVLLDNLKSYDKIPEAVTYDIVNAYIAYHFVVRVYPKK